MAKRKYLKEDREWSKQVRERDQGCVVCGKTDGHLSAHHIIPEKFPEFKLTLINGVTLCYTHHLGGKFSAHKNAVWFTNWLKTHKPYVYEWACANLRRLEDE